MAKAGLLHDIGVLKVSKYILDKEGFYNQDEYEKMKKHTQYGYEILKASQIEEELCEVCLYHHERINGNGYPNGLIKNDIPELAQIIGFLGVFVSYNSEKPYRRRYGYLETLSIMQQYGPGEFDVKYIHPLYNLYKKQMYSI